MEEKELAEKVYLCFIKLIGEETDGYYRYEFVFTDNKDAVWGENFEQKPSCLINDLMVSEEYVYEIHVVKMKIKLDLIQNNCCFSMSDCYDGIVALGWSKNLEDELYFNFGDSFECVEKKLSKKSILFG